MPDAADDTRSAVAAVADTLAADLEALAGRWRAGTLNDSDFRLAMAQAIKRGHVAAAAVAAGGKADLTPAALGAAGSRLRDQYKYLDAFVRGVDDPAGYGNAAARAAMYGAAIVGTYEDGRRRVMRDEGATRERRVIGATADSCPECLAYAALGWQPIGSLPGVGEACSCKSRCHCHFEHDGAAADPAVALAAARRVVPAAAAAAPAPPAPIAAPGDEPLAAQVARARADIHAAEAAQAVRFAGHAPDVAGARAAHAAAESREAAARAARNDPHAPAAARAAREAEYTAAVAGVPAAARALRAAERQAALRRDIPHAVPPGPIAGRIAQDEVAAAVHRHVLEAADQHEARVAAARADRDAAAAAQAKAGTAARRAIGREDKLTDASAGAAKVRATAAAARRALDEAYDAYRAADRALDEAHAARDAHLRALLAADAPAAIAWQHGPVRDLEGRPLDPLAPGPAAKAEAGRAFLAGMVRQGGGLDALALKAGQPRPGADPRAHFSTGPDGPYVKLAPHDDAGTAVHELGHAIEEHGGGAILARSREFLAHRVGDEPPRPLKEVLPRQGYRADETGRKDGFDKAFGDAGWYVGKDYGGGGTEILSMGVEKLHDDPGGFAKADPEYFKYTVGILRGTLR